MAGAHIFIQRSQQEATDVWHRRFITPVGHNSIVFTMMLFFDSITFLQNVIGFILWNTTALNAVMRLDHVVVLLIIIMIAAMDTLIRTRGRVLLTLASVQVECRMNRTFQGRIHLAVAPTSNDAIFMAWVFRRGGHKRVECFDLRAAAARFDDLFFIIALLLALAGFQQEQYM